MSSSYPPPRCDDADSFEREFTLNRGTMFPTRMRDIETELSAWIDLQLESLVEHFTKPLTHERALAARIALLGVDSLHLDELVADPNAYVCVGRHTEASVRAANSESLSLRHLLLIPFSREGEKVRLDVVPLAPTVRIAPWSRPLPSRLAEICLGIVLGDSLLLVAPAVDGSPGSALHFAPSVATGLKRQRQWKPKVHEEKLDTRITSIYSMTEAPVDDSTNAPLVLEVRSAEQVVAIRLREDWLERGLVLGRNEHKCSHSALAAVLASDYVSRCHLFLRREDDAIVFYDTASTAGVFVGDEQVRRIALPAPRRALEAEADPAARIAAVNPAGVTLELTEDVRVTLMAT